MAYKKQHRRTVGIPYVCRTEVGRHVFFVFLALFDEYLATVEPHY